MSKTLRIISVIAALFIVVLVALPALSGSQIDLHVQDLLNGPGVIEIFKKNLGNMKNAEEESPLVKQARVFALFLNPPPPPPPPPARDNPVAFQNQEVRPPQVTVKFDLVATSFYALRPELSLALIDQPGSGLSWVRQSSKVEHLTIEEIKDGSVVINDGSRTYEITTQRPPKVSLIKGENGNPNRSSLTGASTAPVAGTRRINSAGTLRPRIPDNSQRIAARANQPQTNSKITATEPQQPEMNSEEIAKWEKFMAESQHLSEEEWLKKAEEMLTETTFDSRISEDEAHRLDRLGHGLNDINEN